MENLDQNKAVYYRDQLVNFIDFDKIYYSLNVNDVYEERVIILIGSAMLNVASKELTN